MNDNNLQRRLEAFLEEVPVAGIIRDAVRHTGRDEAEIAGLLATYINETRVTLDVVEPCLRKGQRILEVGAGLCLFSLFLKKEGFTVTALEPALGGYGVFDTLRRIILEHYSNIDLPVLVIPASDLHVDRHGCFNLIFSNNVIEHIPDWKNALCSMEGVLSPNGTMIHACPNYTIPYEPHYGIPVLRRLPGLSRRILLFNHANMEVWNSLNFITCSQIKNYCSRRGLSCSFKKGLLYQSLKRIDSDPLFRRRHHGIVMSMATLLLRSGLAKWLGSIPATLATPMIVRIERAVVEH